MAQAKATRKRARTQTRAIVAKRLEDWAKRVREGKPIRIGKKTIVVPARVMLETELETQSGVVELELELKWAAEPTPKTTKPKLKKK